MSIDRYILLSNIIFLAACSSSSENSETDKQQTCRNFSTSSITDGGITETCSFDKKNLILRCDRDSGTSYNVAYNSIDDFVLESKTLGLTKATVRNDGLIQVDYSYEDEQLISVNIDFSAGFGDGAYLNITHSEFDDLNRPIFGISESNFDSNCSGLTTSLNYNELENRVGTVVSSTTFCPYLNDQESFFDQDGNLVRHNFASFSIEHTVQSTEQVCF